MRHSGRAGPTASGWKDQPRTPHARGVGTSATCEDSSQLKRPWLGADPVLPSPGRMTTALAAAATFPGLPNV